MKNDDLEVRAQMALITFRYEGRCCERPFENLPNLEKSATPVHKQHFDMWTIADRYDMPKLQTLAPRHLGPALVSPLVYRGPSRPQLDLGCQNGQTAD